MRKEQADAAAYASDRRCVYTHQIAVLFCGKWCKGSHLERKTPSKSSVSVNQCVFTWRTLLPNFIPIRFETTEPWGFWRGLPQQEELKKNNNNNNTSSDMRSVPDPKRSISSAVAAIADRTGELSSYKFRSKRTYCLAVRSANNVNREKVELLVRNLTRVTVYFCGDARTWNRPVSGFISSSE